MDLMTLAAKITLDDSGFVQGVNKAEKTGQKLAGKMSAMTVAAGNIAADMVRKGIGAINNVISGAIDGYADYQQLIGGVETLFKSSADKVAKYAKQSFKTTGLSANDYMETVTSFSASLIQGLGGDTAKAAELADMAVTDMADNANKMGTDISSIQAAYQGFAKQNFTMLDNLKLGYGGTRGEMVRLINDAGILDHEIENLDDITFDQLVQAIHKIQENLGITGTTAKEAKETLTGSKNSLKAAWKDLLSVVGGEGDQQRMDEAMDNFKTSFQTYMDNFIPTMATTIANSDTLVEAVADGIANLPTDLLSKVGEEGMKSGAGMIRSVSKVTNWLIDSMINAFKSASIDNQAAVDLGAAIGDFIGSGISKIVTNGGTILSGIIALGSGLAEGLATGLFEGLFGQGAEVDEIAKAMTGELVDAETAATKSGALLAYMQSLADKYGDAVKGTTEWKEAVQELETYMPGAGKTFQNYGRDIQGAIDVLELFAEKQRQAAVNAALNTALQESYGLLARQDIEYRKQEAAYNRNQSVMESIRGEIIGAIQKAATEKIATFDENGGPVGAGQTDYYNKLTSLAEGMSHVGDRMTELEDLDFDELKDALNFLDITDFSDEKLEAMKQSYAKAEADMATAKAEMDNSLKEIEATKSNIQDVKAAVEAASKDLNTSFDGAAGEVDVGGAAVATALAGAAAAISSVSFPSYVGVPKATGMDNVPFNGYKAELHRGEGVLTASENKAYREGRTGGTSEIVGAVQGLRNDLQNMKLVVGRKTFGRAVTDYGGQRLSGYIGQSESQTAAGFGT